MQLEIAPSMTYMKMVAKIGKRHLVLADKPLNETTTLCGCEVTRPLDWTRISSLEGDECRFCAELAFGGSADHRKASQYPAI
jgi:hypothetical protein